MRRLFLALLAFALFGRSATAQSAARGPKPDPRKGGVEGDMYMVFMSGDMRQGAGQTVYLLRDDAQSLVARLAFCAKLDIFGRRLKDSLDAISKPVLDTVRAGEPEVLAALHERRRDTLTYDWLEVSTRANKLFEDAQSAESRFRDRMSDTLLATVQQLAIGEASTGMHAHYRFDGLKAGRYILYAQWFVNGYTRRWWVPVAVTSTGVTRRDLDGSVSVDRWLDCENP